MANNERELEIINEKISNDERLINEFQANGISEKKINKIKVLRDKHLAQKNEIESRMQ